MAATMSSCAGMAEEDAPPARATSRVRALPASPASLASLASRRPLCRESLTATAARIQFATAALPVVAATPICGSRMNPARPVPMTAPSVLAP